MSFDALMAFAAQNPILSSIFVVLTVALVYTEAARLFVGYKTVSPAQLTDLINRESALLVDVSAIAEFEKGHILGAKHVAMSQFDPENKLLAKAKELPVAVVCRTGQSSSEAAKRLHKAGFTRVYWLNDGLNAWIQADLPLTKGR
ncbi:rhodanese-like domain-containing protein [Arenimonas sp. GDDSR-1]|uniref:rhodanese-like domain-containing protein n=1 Tax=Arenimonas sp. GDDSR-1 TaxID=2950125 RepID=UPI002633ECC5|nr:rhodanese-like domain-containing protein [Arenimonas sp. GDDSR-1]